MVMQQDRALEEARGSLVEQEQQYRQGVKKVAAEGASRQAEPRPHRPLCSKHRYFSAVRVENGEVLLKTTVVDEESLTRVSARSGRTRPERHKVIP
jgi:hypothetical protein